MSYSRWGNSRWYTFGCGCKEDNCKCPMKCNIKNHQAFSIDCAWSFSYKELVSDIDDCLDQVLKISEATKEEMGELRHYMQSFIYEVSRDSSCR